MHGVKWVSVDLHAQKGREGPQSGQRCSWSRAERRLPVLTRAQISALQAQNQRLVSHVGEVEAHKGMLTGQVTQLRSKWTAATNDNMRMQAELATLRKTLQARRCCTCLGVPHFPQRSLMWLHKPLRAWITLSRNENGLDHQGDNPTNSVKLCTSNACAPKSA